MKVEPEDIDSLSEELKTAGKLLSMAMGEDPGQIGQVFVHTISPQEDEILSDDIIEV